MKFKLLIISALMMSLSCSNEEEEFLKKIQGSWVWVESAGGLSGGVLTPANTGNKIKLEINSKAYSEFVNNKLLYTREYTIRESLSISGERLNMMFFSNGDRKAIDFYSDTLVLNDECYDCYKSKYIKEY